MWLVLGQVFSTGADYEPLSISISPSGAELAVGGKDMKVHIYKISGDTLTEGKIIQRKGEVLAVGYSPDGAWLASGDSNRQCIVYETGSYAEVSRDRAYLPTPQPLLNTFGCFKRCAVHVLTCA